MILSSSLFDNGRVQTSKIVVIVYIKFLNKFLLSHSMSQTREFAHYQYYFIDDHVWYTIENVRTKSFEHEIFFYFFYWKFLEKRNLQTKRNHSSTKYFFVVKNSISQLFFENHPSTKSFFNETRIRKRICFWIWFDFASLFDRIEMIRLKLIELFAKIVAIASKWRLLLKFFSQWFSNQIVWTNRSHFNMFAVETKWLKFRWYYDQNYCFVLNVDFHVNDLVESNYCKIDAFKKTFRRRLKNWLFRHLFYLKSLDESTIICLTIHVVAFAHSSRKLWNFLFLRLHILKKDELYSLYYNLWNVWFLFEYTITYKSRRFIQQFTSTSSVACHMSQSFENL